MINSISQFFLNRSVKVSSKLLTFMLIILCVWIIDNTTGFSFYKNNYEKITLLKMISELKDNNTLSIESNVLLSEIEQNINNRKSISERIKVYVNSILQTKFVKKDMSNEIIVPRNNLKLFVLTNWTLLLLALILPPVIMMAHMEDGYGNKYKLLTLIGVWISIFIVTLGFYFLVSKIPMIGKNWNINYTIAFSIQPILFFVFYWTSKYIPYKSTSMK